ncbi:SCF ubiquitin ligase complex subunit GRR1 KNAG_0D01450 [Huiozyma naganishii CBS 8797]|uniref:F-box domain-containing protein n=1 Tax=Huiozyma naganishii (strain ATCC MYA-139 / BCRC 22969 / CBS 8797 / KCTC 17520 / NBRC 10181 / NCYC 3082 / Yp74L-3) TaxID=1071383 RepID=J7RXR5_HUIN7|nr:hypothetical protein KNAG_0D01450 [Kazachstania naganishii CBS 8797]CCK69897.1 hypothetical protein KNAG_0D01450 [Kazachstania naganishii CBS 8797]
MEQNNLNGGQHQNPYNLQHRGIRLPQERQQHHEEGRQSSNIQNERRFFSPNNVQGGARLNPTHITEARNRNAETAINSSIDLHSPMRMNGIQDSNDTNFDLPFLDNNKERLSMHNFPKTDFSDFSFELSPSDLESIQLFQTELNRKIEACLGVIDNRRHRILSEIELYKLRLKKMDHMNDPQITNHINKLQRIRMRAVELETIELQRLRIKTSEIIKEFKKEFQLYSQLKSDGKPAVNPTNKFRSWIAELDIWELTNTADHMAELSKYTDDIPPNFPALPMSSLPVANTLSTLFVNERHVQPDRTFPLHKLPSEILHLVLDKIGFKADIVNLLTVCKLWALIIVKILYYRPHINQERQLKLFLRTMKLPSFQTVFNYRLMIKRLNFSFVGDYLNDEQLSYFVGCHNLERLTLVFCKNISSKPISAVLKGCRFLQSVDITGIRDIQDDVFNTLAESCRRVQGFYVPMAKNVSFNALNTFIIHAPMLKRVKITANTNINDEIVEKLADKCPMLVEVDITSCPNVHDSSLLKLFTKLPQLREFKVTHNENISDNLLHELSKTVDQLPALRLIDFSSCENITDKTVERLVDLSPKLRNIYLGKCSRITDTSLFNLSRLVKNLQQVHFGHCFNITDQGVRILVQSCPRIQYVDFACCTNLTNRTLYELSDLQKLKRIGLVKCTQMTDEGLLNMIALRGRGDSLERVHLSYCSNLTIYPIYELLMACPRLSHLSLTAVPSFLRQDITQFCRPAPPDFSENQRQIFCVFSGKGVHKLRNYLMKLTPETTEPQTDINDILTKLIIKNNLIEPNESQSEAIDRITFNLNHESVAILTATGLNQLPDLANDLNIQNIDFENMEDLFTWSNNESLLKFSQPDHDVSHLFHLVDTNYCEDPYAYEYEDTNVIMAPGGNRDLNEEMLHVTRKYHELNERIDDFEVNVASLARIQFQFTGFLLHEMAQIYIQMVELNRLICQIQDRVFASGIQSDIDSLYVWRHIHFDKFQILLGKYQVTTVVLRLYLKESIAAFTRQREIILANERNESSSTNVIENFTSILSAADNSGNFNGIPRETDETTARDALDRQRQGLQFLGRMGQRATLTPDQLRTIQLGLSNTTANVTQDNANEGNNGGRSDTPDEEMMDDDA